MCECVSRYKRGKIRGSQRTADNAYSDFLAQILHERHHFRRNLSTGNGERTIDVKEGENTGLGGSSSGHGGARTERGAEAAICDPKSPV